MVLNCYNLKFSLVSEVLIQIEVRIQNFGKKAITIEPFYIEGYRGLRL